MVTVDHVAKLLIKCSGTFSQIRMSKIFFKNMKYEKNQQIKVELQALRSYYISKKHRFG
jgi:hypothetical protein